MIYEEFKLIGLIILFFVLLYYFYLKPALIRKAEKDKKQTDLENIELRQQVIQFKGIEGNEVKRTVDRIKNVSLIKVRDLITNYNKWQKPMNDSRTVLSLFTTILFTLFLYYSHRFIAPMASDDIVTVAILSFFISFIIWGNIVEIYWKQKQQTKMKDEFSKAIKLAVDPMELRNDLAKWMLDHKDVNDDTRAFFEGLLDKWLKQELEME